MWKYARCKHWNIALIISYFLSITKIRPRALNLILGRYSARGKKEGKRRGNLRKKLPRSGKMTKLLKKMKPKYLTSRGIASLTVSGGQVFHFFSLKFLSIFLIFPQTFLIFVLIALSGWVAHGKALAAPLLTSGVFVKCYINSLSWKSHEMSHIVRTLPPIKLSGG